MRSSSLAASGGSVHSKRRRDIIHKSSCRIPKKQENSVEDAAPSTPSIRITRILSDNHAVLDSPPSSSSQKAQGVYYFCFQTLNGLQTRGHGSRPSPAATAAAALASSSLLLASRLLNAPRHWTSPSSSLAQNL